MLKDIIENIKQGKNLYIQHNIFFLKALILEHDKNFIKIKIADYIEPLIITEESIKNIKINQEDILLNVDINSIIK